MESWDPVWEKVFSENQWGKYPSESLIQFVARNFYKTKRSQINILEVGCGTAANIWFIAREGFNAFGIDGSETAINIAKQRIKQEQLKADLIVGDIVQLPYHDIFFDAVIDNECLYANSKNSSKQILKEICRVLKPNGYFYSRSFTGDMYVGKQFRKRSNNEFFDIKEGPLAEKGFVRLMNKNDIDLLYGEIFEIKSVDILEYTQNNSAIKISEWIIICKKNE